jgi:hypothetical protein
VAVEDDSRVRFVAVEDELQDAPHVPHLFSAQRCAREDLRVASGLEQPVALT